jgi:hypothetical protein
VYTSSIRKTAEEQTNEPQVHQSCDIAQSDTPLAQKSVRRFNASSSNTPRSSHGELQDEDIEEKSALSTVRWTQRVTDSPKRV